jgi:hypothetical protein
MFQSNNSLIFSNLGITSSVSGITVSQYLYDSSTGQTSPSTAFVPSPLNYVLGTENAAQVIVGNGYVGLSFGVLSLTTNSSRITEIQLLPSGQAGGGYLQMNSLSASDSVIFRCLRGPSTFIGDILWLGSGFTLAIGRLPPPAIKFIDFSPPSGAATYIMQANPNGASVSITIGYVKMFVRQL